MTYPASSPSRKFWLSLAAVLALLQSGCSTTEEDRETTHASSAVAGRFEWAVQHYEAGDYPKAIQRFEALRKEGASVPDFDLLPFYLGMSHYRLGHNALAAAELEAFVRTPNGTRQEGQDARIALLLTYERLGRWKDVAALAMETDKLTLYQHSRALLKLVWARSLREQNELLGAKTALDDALPFLDKVGSEDAAEPFYADPDQDLWGRYHHTALLVQESECRLLLPKDIAKPAPPAPPKEGEKPKKRKPRPLRLYAPWLEAATDCHRKAVSRAAEELFPRDTPWGQATEEALALGITSFGEKIREFLKSEASTLDRQRALQKSARENLYRLLATLEENMKSFKNRGISNAPLERLRKEVDRLLVGISTP